MDLAIRIRYASVTVGGAVVVPGFLDPGEGPATSALAAALAQAGWTTVTFDPGGTWGSPGALDTIAPSRQLDSLHGIIDRLPADRPVLLVGYCYGGYLSLLQAARDHRVTDVIALMPSRCFIWPEDYDHRKDTWRAAGTRRFVRDSGQAEREFQVPYAVVEDALRHDLPASVAGLFQRILFVAGDRDLAVPADAVRRLYDECGSPAKRLVVLSGVQHDFRDHPDQIEKVVHTAIDWITGGPDRPRIEPSEPDPARSGTT